MYQLHATCHFGFVTLYMNKDEQGGFRVALQSDLV
ncbi:hypothetical protein FHS10_005039 [Mucilaginibacter dorajii]|nr:hypothetical protein [Mucilaginibacter dorajii]